jgi:hypothetical protein
MNTYKILAGKLSTQFEAENDRDALKIYEEYCEKHNLKNPPLWAMEPTEEKYVPYSTNTIYTDSKGHNWKIARHLI